MRKLMLAVVVVGLLSLPLMAEDTPKVEVFGGYQYLHTGTIHISGVGNIPNSSQGWNGWDASLRGNFNKHFGLEGDFSGTYATISHVSSSVYTYAGGPAVSYDAGGKFNPFAHALFGGVHLTGSGFGVSAALNGFTMMFGGGVDAKVNKTISVRLIQADWLYYRFGSQTIKGVAIPTISQSNNVRIATGIVFTF
jgi:hypothetical protein